MKKQTSIQLTITLVTSWLHDDDVKIGRRLKLKLGLKLLNNNNNNNNNKLLLVKWFEFEEIPSLIKQLMRIPNLTSRSPNNNNNFSTSSIPLRINIYKYQWIFGALIRNQIYQILKNSRIRYLN